MQSSEYVHLSRSTYYLVEWPRAMYCITHILNPAISRTTTYLECKIYSKLCQGIFWQSYSERCVALVCWEHYRNQNFDRFYLGIFRYIQAYYKMIVITTLNYFPRNLKRYMFFDYNDLNFNAQPSLFKWYAISLTKYYCLRNKLLVFKNMLGTPLRELLEFFWLTAKLFLL